MTARFAGRTVLVCGGAAGIGSAISRRLAGEGALVWIQYRTREAEARALRDELRSAGMRAEAKQADLLAEADVAALFAAVGEANGIVHAVSAPLPSARFHALPWGDFAHHFETSVKTAYLVMREAVRPPRRPAAAVFVLSNVTTARPPVEWASYITAKYALWGLVRAMSAELAGKRIRVNAVSPGLTITALTAGIDPRVKEVIARQSPMNRLGVPDDAAAAVAYLLSDEAAYVTGANLPVDGGAS